jgi:hypothetical protein
MGNENQITYVPGSKRYKGNSDKDLSLQVPFVSKQKNYTQGDRTVLLNLAQIFDDERQKSNRFRISGKIKNIFSNSITGKTSYTPYRDDLYYLQPEQSVNTDVWKGYPQYKEFTFIRNEGISGHTEYFTKSASTYNWRLYLSYAFSGDSNQIISYTNQRFGVTVPEFLVSDGIPFVIQRTSSLGKPLITFNCGCKHNLKIGDYVKLSFSVNGKNVFPVYSLGDEFYDSEERVFSIYNIGYPDNDFKNNQTGNFKRIKDLSNTGETTSKYYVRLHKILTKTTDVNLMRGGFENNSFTKIMKLEYSGLTPNKVQRVSVGNGTQNFSFSFDSDINIEEYKDNHNRPISDLFVTIVNRGYLGWFNQPFNDDTTKSAIDIGWEFNFSDNLEDSWWNHASTINKDNIPVEFYDTNGLRFYYNSDLNEGDVLRGDICEWNDYEQYEYVLSELSHKYSFNKNVFQTNINNVTNRVLFFPSGYSYKPHYKIPLRSYSDYVETADTEVDNIPSYAFYSQVDRLWRWRDLYSYGFIDNNGNGVDNPFINNSHYPFTDILFLQTPMIRNTEGIYYQDINLPNIDFCE